MLRGCRDAVGLDAADHGGGLFAGQQGILGNVFEIPAAQRVPVDIDARGQPDHDVVFLRLKAGCAADHAGDFRIPGAAQERGAGKGGRRDAGIPVETDPRGSVRRHDGGNAEGGIVAVAERRNTI